MSTLEATKQKTEAEAVAEIATRAQIKTHLISDRNDHVFAIPGDWKIEHLEADKAPDTVCRSIPLGDADSFIAYCEKWSDETSEFYADLQSRSIKCFVDAHAPGVPSFEDHVVTYPVAYSREFAAWLKHDGSYISQLDMAELLEDRHRDIVVPQDLSAPSGLEMFQIAREFKLVRNMTFGQAQNLTTGEAAFEYTTKNDVKKSVEFPEYFYLGIPIFRGGEPYQLKLRARYRAHEAELKLGYQIIDKENNIEDAFKLELAKIAAAFPNHQLFTRA